MREERLKQVLIAAGGAGMLLFRLLPFADMAVTSFSDAPDFLSPRTAFDLTLNNYKDILTRSSLHFLHFLRNSLGISALSAAASVFIAALAAYALTRLRLAGKVPLLLFILALSMFPQISTVSYLYRMMTSLGWINTWPALVLPYIAWILPLSVWILTSYFAQVPAELDRAALVDGCTRWQVLWKVIFPVAKPGLFSVFLLSFIFAFNEFMFALMLTLDHRAQTIPVGIARFQGLYGQIPWGNIMAASTVTTVPVVILIIVFQRHIIQGLTRGAVKG